MKAEAMSFTFLGNEGAVKIPFFQRGYVWEKSNWEDLLIDLLDNQKSQFLGSLILKQQERQTGKPKEVLVIDGQQRLTTISILIKCLFNSFSEEVQRNCDSSIKNYLFFKQNQTDSNYHIKIQHSRIDAKYFNKVINNEITKSEYDNIKVEDIYNRLNSKDNKILQCFKYFTEKLKENDIKNKTTDLFNKLLDTENKILVVIDLAEKEDEQSIFDTINSAGIRLSGADIVKNAIFQKAIELINDENEVIGIYNEYWDKVFSIDDNSISFWGTSRSTGRLMRDNIEILLHSIAVIKGFFDPDKHTLSDISVLYKNFINSLTKDSLLTFIKEITNYAKIFREKIQTFDRTTLFSFNNNVQRLFHVLDVCEISTFHPYILYLINKHENNDNKLQELLLKLEKYIIRRMITLKETKSYNKTCKEFIQNDTLLESRFNEIDDNSVKLGLESISNKNASLLLFWVELKRRDINSRFDIRDLKYNYSLEHIMPQKWEEFWSDQPVKDSNNNVIENLEDSKKERYSKIYSIGNMTLLTTALNTSLRNYSLQKKINGEGRKKGMKFYAELSITKDDIIENPNLIWDEERINNRTKKLTDEILSIW